MPLHIKTPVLTAEAAYSQAGRPLLFKMDAYQPTGSFKLRGIGLRCERDAAAGVRRFVCASGGNAGIAAAYAATALGIPITIVVPESTSAEARAAIERQGAELRVHGGAFDEANAFALALAAESAGISYLHPYDDPVLWEGHATLIDEVVADGHSFDCVILSVGGGGLLAGIAEGLARNALEHVPIVAVETVGADCLAQSLEAGERVTLPAITSIATSLGAKTVAEHAFRLARTRPVLSARVSDEDALAALLKFADRWRVLVEPACGAALAILDRTPQLFAKFSNLLVVVCGGVGVSLSLIDQWRERLRCEAS